MKTEKELEQMRLEMAKYMPSMPAYKDYEVADQYGYWLIYTGLLETRYMLCKSYNKETKKMNIIKVVAFLSSVLFRYSF